MKALVLRYLQAGPDIGTNRTDDGTTITKLVTSRSGRVLERRCKNTTRALRHWEILNITNLMRGRNQEIQHPRAVMICFQNLEIFPYLKRFLFEMLHIARVFPSVSMGTSLCLHFLHSLRPVPGRSAPIKLKIILRVTNKLPILNKKPLTSRQHYRPLLRCHSRVVLR
jgi:hypothetical protein